MATNCTFITYDLGFRGMGEVCFPGFCAGQCFQFNTGRSIRAVSAEGHRWVSTPAECFGNVDSQ